MFELEFNIGILKFRWGKGAETEKAETQPPKAEPKPESQKPKPKEKVAKPQPPMIRHKDEDDLERDLSYWISLWRGAGKTPPRKKVEWFSSLSSEDRKKEIKKAEKAVRTVNFYFLK